MAFDPHELRDIEGKWVKGMAHLNAAKKIAALGIQKKATINSFPVRNLPGKGYRVRIHGEAINYKHPEDAARSMIAGKHVPAAKHISELESQPLAGNFKKQQILKSLKSVEGGSVGPQIGTVSSSQALKTGAATHFDKVLGDSTVHGSAEWEYEKGLITQEELHQMRIEAMQGKIANLGGYQKAAKTSMGVKLMHDIQKEQEQLKSASGSHVPGAGAFAPKNHDLYQSYVAGDISAQEYQKATGQHISTAAEYAASTAAEPTGKSLLKDSFGETISMKLKSGKPVSELAGMTKPVAQQKFKAGELSQTEFYARWNELPVGAYTSDPSTLDFELMNKLRAAMGLKMKIKPPAKTSSTAKSVPGMQQFNPEALPAGAPPGALIGLDAWNKLPSFTGSYPAKSGIKSYTGSGYGTVNSQLRKGLMASSTVKLADELDTAFKETSPTTFDMVVHRGVQSHDSMFGGVGSHIGGVFIDHGYVSTSTKSSTAQSFGGGGAFIQIIVPKGSKVVNTSGISSHTNEREIILNRGSKFKIVGDSYYSVESYGHASQKRVIVLELQQ